MTEDEFSELLEKTEDAQTEEEALQILMDGGMPEDLARETAARLFGRNLDVL